MIEYLRFLGRFARHPLRTGAIAPSSRHLARLMVSDMGLEAAETVVELGPGTGSFTAEISASVADGATFLAVEVDPDFVRALDGRFPNMRLVHGSAENLPHHLEAVGRSQADAILCGLPWASFPTELQTRILSAVAASLRPGGRFATFAYVHAAWFPTARGFHRRLRDTFRSVSRTRVEWRNLPPAFVLRCEA